MKLAPFNKQVTLRALTQLKRQVYFRASQAAQQCPAKADIIRARADHDASRIAFTIHMLTIKM